MSIDPDNFQPAPKSPSAPGAVPGSASTSASSSGPVPMPDRAPKRRRRRPDAARWQPRSFTPARLVAALVVGAVVGGTLWFTGVDMLYSVAFGGLLAVIVTAWLAYSDGPTLTWPNAEHEPRAGTRTDVSWLAYSFRPHRGSIRDHGVTVLRSVASARLRRHGLDLTSTADGAAIIRLIGDDAYATLTPRNGVMPSLPAVEHCLDMLERLGGIDPAQTAPARTIPREGRHTP